jgi:hypothetical protein
MPQCRSPVAFASRLGQESLVNRFESLLDGRDRIVRKGGIADLTPIPTRLNQNGADSEKTSLGDHRRRYDLSVQLVFAALDAHRTLAVSTHKPRATCVRPRCWAFCGTASNLGGSVPKVAIEHGEIRLGLIVAQHEVNRNAVWLRADGKFRDW